MVGTYMYVHAYDGLCNQQLFVWHLYIMIGASEAKPLFSGWCENRKFGSLGGWVLRRVNTILYGMYVCTSCPHQLRDSLAG